MMPLKSPTYGTWYRQGLHDGFQEALGIVIANFEARKPDDDIVEIIARIVTDIQTITPKERIENE